MEIQVLRVQTVLSRLWRMPCVRFTYQKNH
jgi:hypothetical protein